MLKILAIATLILSCVEAAQDIPLIQDEQRSAPKLVKYKQTKTKYKFTPDDDEVIISLIRSGGDKRDWKLIASTLSSLNKCEISPRRVRERYINFLFPEVASPWTPKEDDKLLELLQIHGSNYNIIAQYFPSRTVNSVKNQTMRLSRERTGTYYNFCRNQSKLQELRFISTALKNTVALLSSLNRTFNSEWADSLVSVVDSVASEIRDIPIPSQHIPATIYPEHLEYPEPSRPASPRATFFNLKIKFLLFE